MNFPAVGGYVLVLVLIIAVAAGVHFILNWIGFRVTPDGCLILVALFEIGIELKGIRLK